MQTRLHAQTQTKPITEKDIVALVQLGIDEQAIVGSISRGTLDFDADDAALQRLKDAGASDGVLQALRDASKRPAAAPAQAITFDQVLQLVQLGIDEAAIIDRLAKSPTIFVLDAQQRSALTQAGASEKLIAAMTGSRPAPPQARDITDLAIILDCSGSMREVTREGKAKMDVAKQTLQDLLRNIPDGLNVTFVIYGHEVYGNAQDPRNCEAVKVARPLSPLGAAGKSELHQMIASLPALGATPIALSLRTAGQELAKNNALCGLVLITDGLETCSGDPAAEAAALAANLKLTFGVHVVGFDVTPDESRSLQQIADAGHGKYYNAASAEELAAKMAALATEITSVSTPKTVDTSRRALRILQPKVEMPPMQENFLVKTGDAESSVFNVVGRIDKYGDDIRIPSPTEKYDLLLQPKDDGQAVYLMRGFTLPERKVVEVRPEEILGMLRVEDTEPGERVFVVPQGAPATGVFQTVQRSDTPGQVMLVPPGRYDVYVGSSLFESGLEIRAGELHRLQ